MRGRGKLDSLTASWSWLLRRGVLPAGDLAMQQGMLRHLRRLEEAQWWPQDRIRRETDAALRGLIRTAYHEVPYYRSLLDRAGVRPSDIHDVDTLARIPISTKASLRAAYPQRVRRNTGLPVFEVATLGSTGTSFRTLYDNAVEGRTRAATILALEWAGWRLGDSHLQTGMTMERDLPRRLKDIFLRCHYFSASDLTDAALDRMLAVIESKGLRFVFGYAVSLYCLAKRASEVGWNRPLTALVSWGDAVLSHYRAAITQAFSAPLFDTYGCAEGIQIAAQCGERAHYHVHDLDVVVEYLDDDGHPVAPGQTGYLVVTRLFPGPMPLIRYRIGDVATPADPGETCACGRGLSLMRGLRGRECDFVVTPSNNRLVVHHFTGILEHFREIEAFQVVQKRVDEVTLRVVPAPDAQLDESLVQTIVRRLQARGAEDLAISVEPVSTIPLTDGGKRRFVISELEAR